MCSMKNKTEAPSVRTLDRYGYIPPKSEGRVNVVFVQTKLSVKFSPEYFASFLSRWLLEGARSNLRMRLLQ